MREIRVNYQRLTPSFREHIALGIKTTTLSSLFSNKVGNVVEIIEDNGFLCFDYDELGLITNNQFLRRIRNPKFLKMFIEREARIRKDLGDQILQAEYELIMKNDISKDSLKSLLAASTEYAGIPIQSLMPNQTLEAEIKKCLSRDKKYLSGTVIAFLAFPPNGKNFQHDIHLAITRMVQDYLDGKKPGINHFIENFGYLESRDSFAEELEDPKHVMNIVVSRAESNPIADYKEERHKIFIKTLNMFHDRDYFRQKMLEMVAPERYSLMKGLIDYFGFSLEYDDNYRRYRTKTFQVLRKISKIRKIDIRNFPIIESAK